MTPWERVGDDGGRISVVHFNHGSVVNWVKGNCTEQGIDTEIVELVRFPPEDVLRIMR